MAVKRQARNGWNYFAQNFAIAIATGTSAEELMTDWEPNFTGELVGAEIVVGAIAGAGAGASRTLTLVRTRGSTDTNMATLTAVLADLSTKGAKKAMTLDTTAGYLKIVDDDKISLAVANGGTQFTTGFSGTLVLKFRAKPQQ